MNTTTTRRTGHLSRGMALLAACATVFSGSAWANPQGAQIVSGQVSMVTSGNQLVITNTPGAVINWQNFSIGAGDLTRFVQQNANSSVLNRVVGQDPSQILGALQSNGKVFLINPNGIVFGAGARVDVNGLVASSLKLSNEDFAAGKLNFSGDSSSGAVYNQGVITTPSGGQVYLIAPNVTNSGLITSPGGDVLLAAGHSVQMADATNPALRVVVSAANDQALNVGDIVAQGGKVGIYGALIRQRGVVNATSAVRGETGQIVFKATGDAVLEAGSVTATSGGDIAISGDSVTIDGTVNTGGGRLTVSRLRNTAQLEEVPPLPTLEQCINNPALTGCGDVLPSIASCIANPTQTGCSLVLPSLNTCISDPTAAGCSVVLPFLATCVSAPVTPGCSVVLPSLASCISNPASAGCSAVLPTLSQCTANPTFPGCSAVLPSLASCISNPTTTGCSVVLPTLSQCTAAPGLSGCSVVLPSLANCISNPTTTGCSAVLPTLSQCTAAPSLVGCSVVLPTLASCISNPARPGCGSVLPTLSQCTANPTTSGCSVVLPSLATCISATAMAGCSVVLPSLSSCTANPAAAGCNVVLPTLAQCTNSPTLSGCAVVLPPVNVCVANPTAPGCSVVVPPTTGANQPVAQAINNTVNIINTVTTTANPVSGPAAAGTLNRGTGSAGSGGTVAAAEKTADKTEVAATDNPGAKNDDAAKKMYCN